MRLRFKMLHGKPNKNPNDFALCIKKDYAEVVHHNNQTFIQIKCNWPGELQKFSDFIKQYIGDGFITTNRFLYIPSEWVFMNKESLYPKDEDEMCD
jgi:hypothetical protein